MHSSTFLHKVAQVAFPKYCYGCGRVGSYLCGRCRIYKINHIFEQVCHVCHLPTGNGELHSECKQYTYLDGVIALGRYEGVLKDLILAAKYQFYEAVLVELAELLALRVLEYPYLSESCFITFVPASRQRKRWRGFNQAEKLANFLCLGVVKGVLVKSPGTKVQAKLDRADRLVNLQNAIWLDKDYFQLVAESRSVVIVDDVFTTGATLESCSRELKRNNPGLVVYSLVLALG